VRLPLPWPAPAEVAGPRAAVELAAPETAGEDDLAPAEDLPLLPLPSDPPSPSQALPPVGWADVVGGVWLSGALFWWSLAARRAARFRRLLRHASPAPAALREQAGRVAARLGLARCPQVRLVPGPVSPLLWGLVGTPRLVLPAALWDRLSAEQRDAVLAHELAHLRRGDRWVRRLEVVVAGLYWWCPVVWWARHELREAEEECCDAWVVWALPGSAEAYAAALLEAVTFLSQARPPLPVGASGVGQVRSLKRRLTMIVRDTPPRSLSWAGTLAVCALGALLLPLWPTRAVPAPPAEEQVEPPPKPRHDPPPVTAEERPPAEERKPETVWWSRLGRAGLAAELEKARDEVELLEVQLEVKRAQLEAAKLTLSHAADYLARITPLRQKGAGVISEKDFEEARKAVDTAKVQVVIREAELKEPEVRLKQAKRRLAAMERDAKGGETPPPAAADEARFRELEKKLDALIKEVEKLRKERRERKPEEGEGPVRTDDIPVIPRRQFRLPVSIDEPQQSGLKAVRLFVSADEGRSWTLSSEITPADRGFSFVAPDDGIYWFAVATVRPDGTQYPADLAGMPPALRVRVRTEDGDI
jgi:beta-lactamase regulating signal transducer with metallopeptidase domain